MKKARTAAEWWRVLPSRPASVRRREFAALRKLASTFERRGSLWQVGAAGFEARVELREPELEGVVVYKVHVLGWDEPRVTFEASVTVWPHPAVDKRGVKKRFASKAWCKSCELALARHGYRGRWRWGKWHFGDFWKRLKAPQDLRAEIRTLEQWAAKPPWSARRRTRG
jgi:hypothetical protein